MILLIAALLLGLFVCVAYVYVPSVIMLFSLGYVQVIVVCVVWAVCETYRGIVGDAQGKCVGCRLGEYVGIVCGLDDG